MVVISRAATAPSLVMHERAGSPSISTVQAPQRPSPQPYLAPVRPRSSRSTPSSVPLAIGVDADRLAVDPQFLDVGHEVRPVEEKWIRGFRLMGQDW